jgi:rhodanese-related sulfurtransferase
MARAQLWLAGVKPVAFLEGHMLAWKQDGLPVETGPGPQPADEAASPR